MLPERASGLPPTIPRSDSPPARGRVITEFSQLEALTASWDQLHKAGRRPEIFQTFGWIRAAWRAYGATRQLAAVAVHVEDVLVGVLPLTLDGRTLRFLAAPGADYNDLLCDAASSAQVLSAALDALAADPNLRWSRCKLENVPSDGNLAASLEWLPRRFRARMVRVETTPCPTLVLGSDREEQLRPLLAKDSLKRHQAKLQKKGKLAFRHIEDRDEIHNHIGEFFRQHIRRRAMVGESSQFLDLTQRVLYEALVEEFDPTQTLRFAVLELNDRPIAYHFGFEFDGKFIWYKPSFDVALWDSAPGEVLIRHLLIYCKEADVREFDFTVGDEAFKYRFANHERRNLEIAFYRSEIRGRVNQLAGHARVRLKQRRPRAWATLKAAVSGSTTAVRGACRTLRRKGLVGTAGALARRLRIAALAFDEVLIFVHRRPLRPAPPESSLPTDHFRVRLGSLADLADLAAAYPDEMPVSTLHSGRERLKRGDQLFAAIRGDQIVHTAWVGRRDTVDVSYEVGAGSHVPLEVPAPVIYDCWTPPPHRGQGIYPRVLRHLAEQRLAEAPAVYIYALTSNRSSCRGIEKAGFAPWRRLGRLRLLGFFQHRWSC